MRESEFANEMDRLRKEAGLTGDSYAVTLTIFEGCNNAVDYKTINVYADSKQDAAEKAEQECRRRDNWVKIIGVRKIEK